MGTFILCDIPCHSLKSFIFGPRSFKLKMHSNSHILIIVSEKIILNHMLVTACQLITVSSSCWILSLPFHLQPQAAGELDLITDPIGHPEERSQRITSVLQLFVLIAKLCKTHNSREFHFFMFNFRWFRNCSTHAKFHSSSQDLDGLLLLPAFHEGDALLLLASGKCLFRLRTILNQDYTLQSE